MMKQTLPQNWIVLNSKTHPDRVYYFNVKTNQSSWEEPTAHQPEQSAKKSAGKKRKKTSDQLNVTPVEPTTPEQDAPTKQSNERKKLVARRMLPQTQQKPDEEKETPQMRAIRETMNKRKQRHKLSKPRTPKHAKNVVNSPPSGASKSCSATPKSESDSSPKLSCTPQMKAILQRMQDKAAKNTPKAKKADTSGDQGVNVKQGAKLRRLRSQIIPADTQDSPKVEKSVATEKITVMEKSTPTEKSTTAEKITATEKKKQTRKVRKKNLGTERMEKLRKSLTLELSSNESPDTSSVSENSPASIKRGKLSSIYKHAEVRLVRLKDRFSKSSSFTNKTSSIDQHEKTEKSPEVSVTANDLANQSYNDSFYEEMDWEPMEDEKITFEVQAVRSQLCAEIDKDVSCTVTGNVLSSPSLPEQQEKRQLYIVVDTNVFLSNIDAVELAKDSTFKTYDRPLIVIPWTVIRELDYIKADNGKTKPASLCAKARRAINYINKQFSSKHPRIIGQTRKDVLTNKEKFSIDCPDDEILQTCLQIQEFGKSVILLSYDINLCNKAMIHDIVTLGRNDPLEKVDYLNATTCTDALSRSLHEQDGANLSLDSISGLSQERRMSDAMYEDAKSVIRDFLTVIVSKEMHSLYGESWEKRVIIRPPWTVITVLQCAIKHWIAAISESFMRKAEAILKELLHIFKNIPGERTLKEVGHILNKCSDLIQMVNVDRHPDLMLRASQKMDELRKKYHDFERQISEQKLCDAIGVENDVQARERRAQKAFQFFEAAYTFARDMCGLAAEAAGMPCSFHYIIPNPLPTPDYVKQIQPELAANVNRLLHTLSAGIEQVKDSCVDYRTLINLYQTLVTFLPDKLTNDLAPLDVYCCMKQKEEVLKTGLRQLQELSTHFCRLASYRCT
ncbi:swt1 RNA endoribonuclease isoform X2 [Andrena cerasifolii]|uniref:swt1 RNA endoribonuclease isoform X2 n=1 Tax=Andrena cerasifolii TaxID=2819439 RepID=UPI00403848E3